MLSLLSSLRAWLERRRLRQVTLLRARERVARGAAFLDEVDPGWYHRLDADTLELSDGSCCVLGQLHGDFRLGLGRTTLFQMGSAPRANLSPATFGFHALQGLPPAWQNRDYAYLNEAWREEIRRRQGPAPTLTKEVPPRALARVDARRCVFEVPA